MRILWIVNSIFPEPSIHLGYKPPVGGGWMYGIAKQLSLSKAVNLSVATTYSGKVIEKVSLNNVDYYLLPCKNNLKYDKKLEAYWKIIISEFKPDLVHVHGTEYAHGLSCLRILPNLLYVVSIQGLVSIYQKYYYADISFLNILRNLTFRDLIQGDTIIQGRKKFVKRGVLEKEYIQRTGNVIGRTSWDFAHAKNINPNVSYQFCNESLRDSFYNSPKWTSNLCHKHSIFLSQAVYPIKGLHQVLKALILLKADFPNIMIRVAGANLVQSNSFVEKIRLSGYGKYIKTLINKHGLNENIKFLGPLTEEQMVEEYLKCNVFICPSSIENSPNSVGEAQLLGVPVIASYVGGIPDMIHHHQSGLLYRFEEIEMLAEYIRKVFNNVSLAEDISKKGIEISEIRHDSNRNLQILKDIYNNILEK